MLYCVQAFSIQIHLLTFCNRFIIQQELVNTVKGYGGRFLSKNSNNFWYEIPDNKARKKASQGELFIPFFYSTYGTSDCVGYGR